MLFRISLTSLILALVAMVGGVAHAQQDQMPAPTIDPSFHQVITQSGFDVLIEDFDDEMFELILEDVTNTTPFLQQYPTLQAGSISTLNLTNAWQEAELVIEDVVIEFQLSDDESGYFIATLSQPSYDVVGRTLSYIMDVQDFVIYSEDEFVASEIPFETLNATIFVPIDPETYRTLSATASELGMGLRGSNVGGNCSPLSPGCTIINTEGDEDADDADSDDTTTDDSDGDDTTTDDSDSTDGDDADDADDNDTDDDNADDTDTTTDDDADADNREGEGDDD